MSLFAIRLLNVKVPNFPKTRPNQTNGFVSKKCRKEGLDTEVHFTEREL